ncbi:rod shape-determining protein MreD [Halocynthiibacter sp. C4]|uniref:rod shape-determining protein MreD n=1 Tax=Halocynthiibacter sp. C4 TaxID=2992758 RepID=UPI00237A3A9D|nr:rod shape-determining protein MreD [Halocynthiibacter sp. C4]MDE0590499.1 rod shape-determining protein MreD [Halocynthiibacter sp. C4]
MDSLPISRAWFFNLLFVVVAFCTLFLHLLPFKPAQTGGAAPDLMLCITYAWVLRRPDYVPVFLLAVVFLTMDLFFMRPPGLQTALIILGAEFLRNRAQVNHELPFLIEWLLVASVMVGVMLGGRFILFLVGSDLPSLSLTLQHLAGTVLLYPVVVILSTRLLGVRKPSPGDLDARGQRA